MVSPLPADVEATISTSVFAVAQEAGAPRCLTSAAALIVARLSIVQRRESVKTWCAVLQPILEIIEKLDPNCAVFGLQCLRNCFEGASHGADMVAKSSAEDVGG